MKRILTKDNVKQAIQDLVSHGKKPTQAAILASLGGGSMGTLVRIMAEIDTEARALNDSPEALKLFREDVYKRQFVLKRTSSGLM